MSSSCSFLPEASRIVGGEVVVHARVVIGAHVVADHNAAREIPKERVVDENFVGGAVPELNAPAGIVEGNVVIGGATGARATRIADVDAVNIVARRRERAVVVDVVAGDVG